MNEYPIKDVPQKIDGLLPPGWLAQTQSYCGRLHPALFRRVKHCHD
jgi:hypothetical protein